MFPFLCQAALDSNGYGTLRFVVSDTVHFSFQAWSSCAIAKRTKSKSKCNSLNSPRDSVNVSVFWVKCRECRRSFCFTSVLGTPDFSLKEIFKIIHHSSLFVWVLSESWSHSRASHLFLQFRLKHHEVKIQILSVFMKISSAAENKNFLISKSL